MGKLAHDNEALGSADTVNDVVVLRQFMFLSGEICLSCDVEFVLNPVGPTGKPSPGMSMSYQLT